MLPKVQTKFSAGADLHAANAEVLYPGEIKAIPTTYRYHVNNPKTVGLVRGRSSLAFKYNVWAFEGTIDADYEGGVVSVLLHNKSEDTFFVKENDRIGQIVIVPHFTHTWFEVEDIERTGGFGSTDNRDT